MWRLVRIALMTGIPFGLFMGAFFILRSNLATGVALGLLCAVLFGLAMSTFAEMQRRKMQSLSGVFEGEPVIWQGPANHFMRAEGRGGWLTLTPTRLAFRSHGKNIQNQPVNISLHEIATAQPSMTARVVPNGLRVTRKNGTVESFVVSGRNDWARAISRAAATDQPSQSHVSPLSG